MPPPEHFPYAEGIRIKDRCPSLTASIALHHGPVKEQLWISGTGAITSKFHRNQFPIPNNFEVMAPVPEIVSRLCMLIYVWLRPPAALICMV